MQAAALILVHVRCSPALLCAGIVSALRQMPEVCLGAATAASRPDVLVADYEQGLAWASTSHGNVPAVLLVTSRQSPAEVRHALARGVRGYLSSTCSTEDFCRAVRAVAHGQRCFSLQATHCLAERLDDAPLTQRELDVLTLVVQGIPNVAIACRLGIGVGTVKTHVRHLFEKLAASSRTEVAMLAERRGLLKLPRGGSSPPCPGLVGAASPAHENFSVEAA